MTGTVITIEPCPPQERNSDSAYRIVLFENGRRGEPRIVAGPLAEVLPKEGWYIHAGTAPIPDGRDSSAILDLTALAMILHPQLAHPDIHTLADAIGMPASSEDDVHDRMMRMLDALAHGADRLPYPVLHRLPALLRGNLRTQALARFFEDRLLRRDMTASDHQGASTGLDDVIRPDPDPPPPRPAPPEAITPIAPELANECLGPGGRVAAAFPNYEFRQGQLDMAHAVIHAFNHQTHLLVEAGTGTGKSMAYLVPAVHWAVTNRLPVVVSTNTKNLQAQLFEKDLPLIRAATGLPFRAALIKGRSNYLCLRKLIYLLDHADFELRAGQHELTASVLVWITRTLTGDLSEVAGLEQRGSAGYAALLASSAEECGGRSCRHFRQCFLRRVRAHAMAADVVIANHALVFADMGERAQAIPPHGHLILDEAHNLEEAATRHFTLDLSRARIRFLLRRLGRLRAKGGGTGLLASCLHQLTGGAFGGDPVSRETIETTLRTLNRCAEQVEEAMDPFARAAGSLLPSGGGTRRLQPPVKETPAWRDLETAEHALRAAVAALIDAFSALTGRFNEMDPATLGFHHAFVQDFDALRAGFCEWRDDVAYLMGLDAPGMVFWAESDDRLQATARLHAAPIDVGESLCEALYRQKQSIIFTSATLSVRDRFTFLTRRLGLDRIEPARINTLNVGTPFDYARQSVLMAPMFLPDPTASDQAYETALGGFLARLYRRTGGRGLTLFTSYTMLQQATAAVRDALHGDGIEVLAQGESLSRETLTEQFRLDIRSVLMGTHSFWEGVDLVGETLSCVVMARLPFAVFTDPVPAARSEAIEAAGESAFTGFSLPNAVIRFRQGFGRLIRHRADRGVVIVADRRLMTKRYGHWFRGSISAPCLKFYDEESLFDAVERFLEP